MLEEWIRKVQSSEWVEKLAGVLESNNASYVVQSDLANEVRDKF